MGSVRLEQLLLQVFRGDPSRWVRADGFATARGRPRSSASRPAAHRVPRRSSLVHGDADGDVPVQWSEQFAADVPDAELCTYPGADHMAVHDAARDDVIARILASVGR